MYPLRCQVRWYREEHRRSRLRRLQLVARPKWRLGVMDCRAEAVAGRRHSLNNGTPRLAATALIRAACTKENVGNSEDPAAPLASVD